MLRDLTISSHPSYQLRREFNLRTHCVSAMFLEHLSQFDAGPFRKIILEAAETSGKECDKMVDVLLLRRAFDFDAFWKTGATQATLANFLHAGLRELAIQFGWPVGPVDRALSEMTALHFDYIVDWKRPVFSRSRRQKAQLRYYYGPSEVRLVALVQTKDGKIIQEVELATTLPHELKFVPLLGRLRWEGEDTLLLEPKSRSNGSVIRVML